MEIKDYKTIQDELAERLTKKEKEFFRCPNCGTVYKDCCGLINCGHCDYTREDYTNKKKTIIKKVIKKTK